MPNQNDAQEEVPVVPEDVGVEGGEAREVDFFESRQLMVEHLEEDPVIDDRDLVVGGLLSQEGSFCVVYRGTYHGMPVAIKQLREGQYPRMEESFRVEGRVLSLLRHPNICEYVGHTEEPFRIVMRLYPCNLAHAVTERDGRGNPVLKVEDRFRIASQLASALEYLHQKGLLHRDVKLQNVLLDENNNVKLGGFALTMYAPGRILDIGDAVGAPLYMAPEVLSRGPFDARCEVYTFGLMLYELFTTRRVFPGVTSIPELLERQRQPDLLPLTDADWSQRFNDGLPPRELWDFAKRCWSYNPDERPTMAQVVREIVAIGVRAAIPRSPLSGRFWLTCSSSMYRDHLQLSEIVPRAVHVEGINLQQLITLATPPSWNLMTIAQFWMLCCWFPSFFLNRESQMEMRHIVESPWFVSDETEANNRLRNPSTGLFVIKPSTTDPFNAPFTVFTRMDGLLVKHRIYRMLSPGSNDTKSLVFCCQSFTGGRTFPSIGALVDFVIGEHHFAPATAASARPQNLYLP